MTSPGRPIPVVPIAGTRIAIAKSIWIITYVAGKSHLNPKGIQMNETMPEPAEDDGTCGGRAPKIFQLEVRWDERPKKADLKRYETRFEAGDIVICRNTLSRVRSGETRTPWIVGMVDPNEKTLSRAGEFYDPKWALKFAQLAHHLVMDCLKDGESHPEGAVEGQS